MTPEQVKLAWKILRDKSVKTLLETYERLNVPMPLDSIRGESFYDGAEQYDGTIDKDACLAKTVLGLFMAIKGGTPVLREGDVVWTEGTGKPSYWFSEPYGFYHDEPTKRVGHKTYSGKLMQTGKYGLGVAVHAACKLWGEDAAKSLPSGIAT